MSLQTPTAYPLSYEVRIIIKVYNQHSTCFIISMILNYSTNDIQDNRLISLYIGISIQRVPNETKRVTLIPMLTIIYLF